MSNPYVWLILSVCTIISVPFAVYTWLAGKQKKEISFSSSSNIVISVGKSQIEQLEILFSGNKISDLTSTKYYIWNSGNEVLHATDLVKSRPISISGKNNSTIMDVRILRTSEDTNCFAISKFVDNRVEIEFDYVASGEGILVQLLHTGDSCDLEFDCKIKGGKPPYDCSDDEFIKNRSALNWIVKTFNDFLTGVSMLLVGICSVIYESASRVPGAKAEAESMLTFVIWGYIILGVVLIVRFIIWHSRHGSSHSIPKTLRSGKK